MSKYWILKNLALEKVLKYIFGDLLLGALKGLIHFEKTAKSAFTALKDITLCTMKINSGELVFEFFLD